MFHSFYTNKSVSHNLDGAEVIFGVTYPWQKSAFSGDYQYIRNSIVAKPLCSIPNELFTGAEEKAFMSWDGLIRPISLSGAGNFPSFTTIPVSIQSDTYRGNSQGMQPPIKEGSDNSIYDLKINYLYLNPLINTDSQTNFKELQDRHVGTAGHDIEIINRLGYIPNTGTESAILPIDQIVSGEENDPYAEDYMFFGLRGPMIMQSWAYDLNGKPIPNAADNEIDASGGIFVTEGLKDKFLDDWARKSHTWPVGPIDLRWDRKRSCYVSPPSYRLLQGEISGSLLPGGNGIALITTGEQLWDSDGNPVSYNTTYVNIVEKLDCSYDDGDKVIIYFDPQEEVYYPITIVPSGASDIHMILARSTGEVVESDTYFGVDNISVIHGDNPGTPLTGVVNQFDEWISDNAQLIIVYNEQLAYWHPIYNDSATHLSGNVNESYHVEFDDETFEMDNILGLDGYFEGSTLDSVYNTYNEFLSDNAKVLVIRNAPYERWEVVTHNTARHIYADVDEAGNVLESTTTFSADNVSGIDGYFDDASISNAYNVYGDYIFNNARVLLIHNDPSKRWDVLTHNAASMILGTVYDLDHIMESETLVPVTVADGMNGWCPAGLINAYNTNGDFCSHLATVIIERNHESSRWDIVSNNTAKLVKALVNEALNATSNDTYFDVDTVQALDGYFADALITGVKNVDYEWFCDNAPVRLVRDKNLERWIPIENASARLLSGQVTTAEEDCGHLTVLYSSMTGLDGYYEPTGETDIIVQNPFNFVIDEYTDILIHIADNGVYNCIQYDHQCQSGSITGETTFLGISKTEITAADWESSPRPRLGSGTVYVYNLSGDHVPGPDNPSGLLTCSVDEETWYSIAPQVIVVNKVLVSNLWQGIKLITVETCDPVTRIC